MFSRYVTQPLTKRILVIKAGDRFRIPVRSLNELEINSLLKRKEKKKAYQQNKVKRKDFTLLSPDSLHI
jgi:hypothetical protein